MQQQHITIDNMFTFIGISQRHRHSLSSAFIRVLICDIKGKTEHISHVWRQVACEENNCSLKISVIKICWEIIIVYAEEFKRIITIKVNYCYLNQIIKSDTRIVWTMKNWF